MITTPAKITRPSFPDALPRNRLFRLLDKAKQKRVIWFSAPAGSGKTTLASSYIQTCQIPCLWYQIDEGDSDIASFFYYMGLAFKTAVPRHGKSLPLLTPEYALGIPTFTKRFFEDLFGRLPKPAALVLDNYQEVSRDSPLHHVVRDAMRVIPRGFNVFVLSRNDSPKPFARLKANQSLAKVGWSELRFSRQETRDLVKVLVREGLTEDLINLLHQRLDGWAAGLILMMSQPEILDLKPQALSNYTPKEIFDYFAVELFERIDEKLRDFLVKTSIFPRMTASMATELTGEDKAEAILSYLNREQFFTNKYTGSVDMYQYHSLFREFLLAKAHESLKISAFAQMEQKAASLLEKEGHAEDAVALYHESGDLPGMVDLVLRLAPELMKQGRHKTLEQWISSIPKDVIENSPWLLYWLATSRTVVNPRGSRPIFENALLMFEEQEETDGILMSLSGILFSIAYALDDFTAFDVWIPRVEAFRKKHFAAVSEEKKALLTFNMVNALTMRQPNHPNYPIWEDQARRLIDQNIDRQWKVQIINSMISHRLFSGDLLESEVMLTEFRRVAQSENITPLALIHLKSLETFYYWQTAEFDACERLCSKSLKFAEDTGVHIMSSLLHGHGAAGSLSTGELVQSDLHLRQMETALGRFGAWEKVYYHLLMTWRYFLEKDFLKARLHAELSIKCTQDTGMFQTSTPAYLGFSIALHKQGAHQRATEYLVQALSICRKVEMKQVEFACLLAKAEFALDLQDLQTATASLKKALKLGKNKGYFNAYFWRPDAMARLCACALEAGIEVEYVKAMIAKRDLLPDASTGSLNLWPWKLKIHTLGEFAVRRDGKVLQFQRKAPDKILSMLKVLLALGANKVQKEKVIDALWPDAEGDIGNQSFATTLHRLRKLLGYPEAVELVEGKLSLNSHYCWIDALEFERFLDEADRAWKGASSEQTKSKSIPLMKKGLDLYKGGFLVRGSEEPWTISARERLRSKFLRAAVRLCECFRNNGEMDDAVECYQRFLEVDDLAEDLYSGLIACYTGTGRAADALSVYERYKNTLSARLGAEPSPRMEAVRRSILRHKE